MPPPFPPRRPGPGGPGGPPPGLPPGMFPGMGPGGPPPGMPGMPPGGGMGPPGMGMGPGMPPSLPPGPPPGAPRPGQGMDPMMAMMGGMPDLVGGAGAGMPPPPPPPGAVMGPGNLPVGGSPFDPSDPDSDMDGSSLLRALAQNSSDPYAGPPDGTEDLSSGGMGDPNMGLQQLLQLLALGQMGAGGLPQQGPPGGGSAMSPDFGNPGFGLM